MKKSTLFPTSLTLFFLVTINSLYAQASFNFTDTLFVFNKTTDFGVLHWYLEILNGSNVDSTLRWKVHFNDKLPKAWDITFDDQTTFHGKVNHLDSADFALYSNLEFPQKLIIGNNHNNVASSNDTVRFDIYYPSKPDNRKSIYFVFNITNRGPLDITSSNKIITPKIYPNPCSSVLILHNFNTQEPVQIINTYGKVIQHIKVLEQKSVVQMGNLSPGFYFVKQNNLLLPVVKQ